MTGDVVGRRVPRRDAVAKVTGKAVYVTDMVVPGMLHAVLVRSSIPHGVLRGVDVAAAEAHPGVVATLTGAEIASLDPYFGEWIWDQPPLAIERIRYAGEPIVGVIAETERAAREAADLVVPDIEPLEVLATPDAAMARDDLSIHPERDSGDPDAPNVCYRADFEFGDVDTAIAEAAYVHRAVYTFPSTSHCAMESHACIAGWGEEGLEVWSGTQQPFKVHADLSRIFGVPLSQVRMRVPYVGGGFGGKGQAKYEPVTVAMARKAGRPVKLVVGTDESFLTVRRHSATIEMTTAVDAAGNLTARDTRVVYDTGAYADKGPRVAKKGAYRATGPYNIPNVRAVGLAVYTNTVPSGAFRGFSTPQVVWAGESAIDEVAEHLGEDPLAFRAARLAKRGDPFLGDDAPLDADLVQGLSMAAEAIDWADAPPPGRGRGLAVAVKDGGGGTGRSEAAVRLHPDGSVEVLVATSELGQGPHTVFAQLVADALGAPLESVRVRFADTSVVPFDRGTNASRSTVAVGSAVLDAARKVRAFVAGAVESSTGSAGFRLDATDVVLDDGGRTPLATIMAKARGIPEAEVGPLIEYGVHEVAAGAGPLGSTSLFYEVGHGAAEVDVDAETGQVRLLRYASVADVGRALNPITAEGQDEGATMMAIGHTFFESLEFDDGEPLNANLVEYRVPRTEDLPAEEFHTILLENGDGAGPYGAKGAGEGGIIPVSPAVANAVRRATGVRIRELPLTPERVWRALNDTGTAPVEE